MCLPQNTQRRLSAIGLAIAPMLLSTTSLPRLDALSSDRQGTPCGRVNPCFKNDTEREIRFPKRGGIGRTRASLQLAQSVRNGQARGTNGRGEASQNCDWSSQPRRLLRVVVNLARNIHIQPRIQGD